MRVNKNTKGRGRAAKSWADSHFKSSLKLREAAGSSNIWSYRFKNVRYNGKNTAKNTAAVHKTEGGNLNHRKNKLIGLPPLPPPVETLSCPTINVSFYRRAVCEAHFTAPLALVWWVCVTRHKCHNDFLLYSPPLFFFFYRSWLLHMLSRFNSLMRCGMSTWGGQTAEIRSVQIKKGVCVLFFFFFYIRIRATTVKNIQIEVAQTVLA